MNTNPSYHNYLLCQNDLCGKWHHANLRWFDNKCGLGTHWTNAMTVYLSDSLWLILSGTSFQLPSPTSWQCRGMVKGRFKISLVLCTWLGHENMSVWWLFPVFLFWLHLWITAQEARRSENQTELLSTTSTLTALEVHSLIFAQSETQTQPTYSLNFFAAEEGCLEMQNMCSQRSGKKVSLPRIMWGRGVAPQTSRILTLKWFCWGKVLVIVRAGCRSPFNTFIFPSPFLLLSVWSSYVIVW